MSVASITVEPADGERMGLIRLRNERLQIAVQPGRGGDIVEFRWLDADLDVMWHNPRVPVGRRSLPSGPHANRSEFYDTFSGGWMLALPGGFFPADYFGAPLGVLGEYGQIPWQAETCIEKNGSAVITLTVRGMRTPFAVSRRISIAYGAVGIDVETVVTNEAGVPLPLIWVEHVLCGGPILRGAKIVCDPAELRVPPAQRPELAQLEADARSAWPFAPLRTGGQRDCSVVPYSQANEEHLIELTGFQRAAMTIWNDTMNLGFQLQWDGLRWPRAWLWAAGRSGPHYPLWGRGEVVGLEPTNASHRPLAELLERGEGIWLPPGESTSGTLSASFVHTSPQT